jgi:hypothetical protein
MAISFVGAGAVQLGANPTVPVPAGYASGDLLIIFISSGTAPTTPSGWTVLYSSGNLFAYYKTAGSSESSVALSASNSNTTSVMCDYRGVGGIDVVGSSTTGVGTSPSTLSQTTTKANDFVISIYQDTAATSATWTAPASTTSRVNSASNGTQRGLLVVDELQASVGASTVRTATLSVSNNWSSITVSIYPTLTTNNSNFFRMF